MNKKIFLSLLLLISIPLISFAQQSDVDPQGDSSCVSIVNNLRYRTTDANTNAEVSVLQDFLQAGGYLKSNPVGFFGIMTTAAVKKFQKENNISPTGYVGPITRQKIKDQTCSLGGVVVSTTSPQIPIQITSPIASTAISLNSPNGGEYLAAGGGVAIDWTKTTAVQNEWLSIYYISEENYKKSITSNQKTIPSSAVFIAKSVSGYYWQIPATLSGAFRILVAYTPPSYQDGDGGIISYGDYSNGYFKISPKPVPTGAPSITVYSPNGGEVIKQGSVVRIKWNSPNVANVYIKLRKGNDTYHNPDPMFNSYEASIALRVNGNEGYVDWTVPTSLPDGTDYSIRVLDLDTGGTIFDDSNSYFTISSGISHVNTQKIISPNGGEIISLTKDTMPITFIPEINSTNYINIVDTEVNHPNGLAGAIIYHTYGLATVKGESSDKQVINVKTSIIKNFGLSDGKYKIEVCANTGCVMSDNYFTLTSL
jgi:peptidoglycan hydrolase-like protein with peptidoglycan-binding domain